MSHVQEPRTAKRRFAAKLGDAMLTMLAVGGSICMVLVILSVVFNISIMMFRTGSMGPTITAGSIAFVREIPATEMSIGDVVTVERGDNILPVTHRVLEILETDSDGLVTFTMQGDANKTADVEPYSVFDVKTVLFSIPKVAPIIQWFSNSLVLGGLTIGASLIVVWAFWPRENDDQHQLREGPPRYPSLAIPAVLLLVGVFGVPATQDVDIANKSSGKILRMASIGDTAQMRQLSPGRSADWTVDIWADGIEEQTVKVDLSFDTKSQDTDFPLLMSLTECSVSPDEPLGSGCPRNSRLLVDKILLRDLARLRSSAGVQLSDFGTDEKRRVIVTGMLSTTAAENQQDRTVSMTLTATGAGEEVSISPDGPQPDTEEQESDQDKLPPTGIDGWQWLVAVGLLLVSTGLTLHKRRKPDSNG